MNHFYRKSEYICPYCNTHLLLMRDWGEVFFCDCHPLKDYPNPNGRHFSWRITYNVEGKTWAYIPKGKTTWVENVTLNPDKSPKRFMFR